VRRIDSAVRGYGRGLRSVSTKRRVSTDRRSGIESGRAPTATASTATVTTEFRGRAEIISGDHSAGTFLRARGGRVLAHSTN
jgi:hypothetical protein